jgi:hypothetical protein
MRMRQQYAPSPYPTPPAPQRNRLIGRVLVAVAVVGFFAAVWFRAGILGLALALALGLLLRRQPHRGRILMEWVGAGFLVLLLVSGAHAPEAKMPTAPKVPAKVEASQADLTDQARSYWSKAFGQLGTLFTEARDAASQEAR